MTATLPRIDQDVLAGIRIGDERSLERLFRESFPTLTQEAAAKLEDRTSAPRVVEGAFKMVWEQRATFETPESLERFLHNTVNECAVRENKRRAMLHRFEAGAHVRTTGHAKHEPTVDEAWNHVASAIHAADSPESHAAAREQASRLYKHDAAAHVASIGKRKVPLGLLGLGAAVAVLIGAPLWWAERSGTDAAAKRALASPDARVVSTLTGQQAAVTLLDGSRATVGADTKLVIAPDFGTTVRAVKLEGAALFAVAPGGKHEFLVRTGDDVSVTAAGTTFGVYAYPGDERVVVGVREGAVTVKSDKGTREVEASKGVVVAKDGAMSDASAGDLDEALAWTQQKLVVANRPLRDAIKQMNRWYALDLRVADSSLLARPVTVNASLESSRDAIAGLEKTGRLAFGYDADRKMVLSDAGAAGDVEKPASAPAKRTRR
jgi:ferric-dicitrate binding protein FerR (iron transport regulator)